MDRRQSPIWLFGLSALPLTDAGSAWAKDSGNVLQAVSAQRCAGS